VSAPVTWDEVTSGFQMEDFRIDNMKTRLREVGDLWHPMALQRGRVDLERVL
jgi:bifunctional non-homologous end joining protein LigD